MSIKQLAQLPINQTDRQQPVVGLEWKRETEVATTFYYRSSYYCSRPRSSAESTQRATFREAALADAHGEVLLPHHLATPSA